MHRSAELYAERGWLVFPLHSITSGVCSCGRPTCGNAGKHPRTPNGFKDATTDAAQIAIWWTTWPDANIGIATGKASGIFVVDVDPRNGGEYSYDELAEQIGGFPDTPRVQTGGGGWHDYFAWPEGLDAVKPRPLGPGIDLKGNGGYVVAPPSTHQSGRRYDWEASARIDEMPLAPVPRALLERLTLRAVATSHGHSSSSDVETTASLIGRAFAHAGMLGRPLGQGRVSVVCPWTHEHTTGEPGDSSACIFAPRAGATMGGFLCLHSHCQHRTWKDVFDALPAEAVQRARAEMPLAPRARTSKPAPSHHDADGVVEGGAADWQDQLIRSKEGMVVPCLVNAALILRETDEWRSVLAFDEFREILVKRAPPPWTSDASTPADLAGDWSDTDTARLCMWLHRTWGIRVGVEVAIQAAQVAAESRPFHPVREYLRSLIWDGTPRLGSWLSTYLGAPQTDYTDDAGRAFLVAAVARVMRPGCKVDTMLVLEGSQGAGKSTAVAELFGHAFVNDSTIDLQSKDRFTALRGKWALEFAELDALGKADIDRVKAFLSSSRDTYRPPYGRTDKTVPRQCVFVGTTNREDYLRDETGGRRFLPVRVGRIALAQLRADRDQLWAEAVHAFDQGAEWWVSADVAHLYATEQAARRQVDAWEEPIRAWLDKSDEFYGPRESCTVGECMKGALMLETAKWTPQDQQRVARILRALGWSQRRSQEDGSKVRRYFRPE
jgi:predicted P-loop ATPase